MKTMNNNHDKFLDKMVRQADRQKAPDDFTNKVMNRIEAETSSENEWSVSTLSWILSSAGLAVAVILIFVMDFSFVEGLFSFQNVNAIDIKSIGQQMVNFWQSLTETFKLTTTTLIILGTAAGLLLLDRVLRTRVKRPQHMAF